MAEMKLPGPEHPITLAVRRKRMLAVYSGHVVADSADAIELVEAGYKPVVYFPRRDVAMEYFARTERQTHCPYKGEASYFTLDMDGHIAENGAWSYERPYPAMAQIEGAIAFYPSAVEVRAAIHQPSEPSPDEAVLHTDAGDGKSQKPHWPETVRNPPPQP